MQGPLMCGATIHDLPDELLIHVIRMLVNPPESFGTLNCAAPLVRRVCSKWRALHDEQIKELAPNLKLLLADLPSCRTLNGVTSVILSGLGTVGDIGKTASWLAGLSGLTSVDAMNARHVITDGLHSVSTVVPSLPNLTHFSMGRVGQADMRHLLGLTTLRSLNIQVEVSATDDDLLGLAALTGLTSLRLSAWYGRAPLCSNACLHLSTRLRGLQVLEVNWIDITDEGLSVIQAIDNLTSLNLVGLSRITDRGIQSLAAKATRLRHLELQRMRWRNISMAGVLSLGSLVGLQVLKLRQVSVDLQVDGWHTLSCLTNLQELDVFDTFFGDSDCEALKHLRALQRLNTRCSCVSAYGITRLSPLTRLTQLSCSSNVVPALIALPQLLDLSVDLLEGRQAGGISVLDVMSQLTKLALSGHNVQHSDLVVLHSMSRLCELEVSTDGDSGVLMTTAGLLGITALTALTKLSVQCGTITTAGIEQLARTLPTLKWLRVLSLNSREIASHVHARVSHLVERGLRVQILPS